MEKGGGVESIERSFWGAASTDGASLPWFSRSTSHFSPAMAGAGGVDEAARAGAGFGVSCAGGADAPVIAATATFEPETGIAAER